MAKATLIWVSKEGDSSRVLRIPRCLVAAIAGGFCVFLLVSVIALWWGTDLYAEVRTLEQDLASQTRQLDEKTAAAQRATQEKQDLEAEVLRIQEADQKIRRFLGLNEQSYDSQVSHQGGLGAGERSARGLDEEDLTAAAQGEIVVASLENTRTLQTSLQEVLDHLQDKQEASRRYPMILPVTSDKAWLSCAFGRRRSPFSPANKEFHNGVDIAGPWKDPILAPADGRVIRVGKDRLLGNYVKIQHTSRIKTMFGHMASTAVESGARVKRGDVIGYMGNSGRSTGTHLHYSVSVDGKYVDPQDYILDRPFHRLKL